jgi:hypothetical protein
MFRYAIEITGTKLKIPTNNAKHVSEIRVYIDGTINDALNQLFTNHPTLRTFHEIVKTSSIENLPTPQTNVDCRPRCDCLV